MKKEFFEILNINNFDTQLVPKTSHIQTNVNHIELHKNMLFSDQNSIWRTKILFFTIFT